MASYLSIKDLKVAMFTIIWHLYSANNFIKNLIRLKNSGESQ